MTSDGAAPTDTASIEEFLRSVWLEVLYVEHVSRTDNFIELGGDSIAAALCLIRVEAMFGVRLEVEVLLVQTLGGVADAIAEGAHAGRTS
jgi:acyl carrier protein